MTQGVVTQELRRGGLAFLGQSKLLWQAVTRSAALRALAHGTSPVRPWSVLAWFALTSTVLAAWSFLSPYAALSYLAADLLRYAALGAVLAWLARSPLGGTILATLLAALVVQLVLVPLPLPVPLFWLLQAAGIALYAKGALPELRPLPSPALNVLLVMALTWASLLVGRAFLLVL